MRISAGKNRTGMSSTGHFHREDRTAEGGGRQAQKNRLVRPIFLLFRSGVGALTGGRYSTSNIHNIMAPDICCLV
ncbi:hypothetical protein CCT19_19435 [Escherichia coli]|nr:hypothetical protein [Escherichia coli]